VLQGCDLRILSSLPSVDTQWATVGQLASRPVVALPRETHSNMARTKSANANGTIEACKLADGTTVYDVLWSYRDSDGRKKCGETNGLSDDAIREVPNLMEAMESGDIDELSRVSSS
jgi:hypothetical protein